jgi:predicted DNA-binding protein
MGATTKATFTLDNSTLKRLEEAAERLNLSKSEVVREAVEDYYQRIGKLSERERLRALQVFDELVAPLPARAEADVAAELAQVREDRRSGGRRTEILDDEAEDGAR